jgi:hypothetical protein
MANHKLSCPKCQQALLVPEAMNWVKCPLCGKNFSPWEPPVEKPEAPIVTVPSPAVQLLPAAPRQSNETPAIQLRIARLQRKQTRTSFLTWSRTRFAWACELTEHALVFWIMVAACLFFSFGGAFAVIKLFGLVFLGCLMLLPSFGLFGVYIWYWVEASNLDAKANAHLDHEVWKLQQILHEREEALARAEAAAAEAEAERREEARTRAEAKRVARLPLFRNIVIKKPLAIIDLETTGINTQTARIVEIGLIMVLPHNRKSRHIIRLNPGVPIPAAASNVHGIFDAHVADKPRFADLASDLLSILDGCDLCGFNLIRFDIPILQAEFARVDMLICRCRYGAVQLWTQWRYSTVASSAKMGGIATLPPLSAFTVTGTTTALTQPVPTCWQRRMS